MASSLVAATTTPTSIGAAFSESSLVLPISDIAPALADDVAAAEDSPVGVVAAAPDGTGLEEVILFAVPFGRASAPLRKEARTTGLPGPCSTMMRWAGPREKRFADAWAVRAVVVRDVRASSWDWECAEVRIGLRARSVRWRAREGC